LGLEGSEEKIRAESCVGLLLHLHR
jgi:hypothetical protein